MNRKLVALMLSLEKHGTFLKATNRHLGDG